MALLPMASLARVTHASLLNILGEDYIRTARAKGLTEPRVMRTHVMRNAIVPILTYTGPLHGGSPGCSSWRTCTGSPALGASTGGSAGAGLPVDHGDDGVYAAGLMLLNVLIELLCEFIDPPAFCETAGDSMRPSPLEADAALEDGLVQPDRDAGVPAGGGICPVLTPLDPYEAGLGATRSHPPPPGYRIPVRQTAGFFFGTDRYGRDILSRLIYGTRTAIFLALGAVGLAALIGTAVG